MKTHRGEKMASNKSEDKYIEAVMKLQIYWYKKHWPEAGLRKKTIFQLIKSKYGGSLNVLIRCVDCQCNLYLEGNSQ